jgi:cell division control protein 6
LYGTTGTGKTSVTRHVLQQLTDFAKNKNANVDGTYINCRNHNSKYRVLIKIVKDLYPEENFLGFSAAFVYEKLLEDVSKNKKQFIIVLDEIDKTKDLDDLVYALTRCNDELKTGSVSLIGISNNLMFKDRLDPRTKSSLCEHEMVFPTYNAQELQEILEERTQLAFKENVVEQGAINLAAAIAARESGDARKAVLLLLRAGEIAEKQKALKVSDEFVKKAQKKVEEEIILNMVSTLPEQQQLVLYTIACLALTKKPFTTITGKQEEALLFSGEVYNEYCKIAKKFRNETVSARWYREYVSELEMFGLIITAASGQGIRGNTRLIKPAFDAKKIKEAIEIELAKEK